MNIKDPKSLEWLINLSKFKALAFFDLETTGVNTVTDRICEICIYRMERGKLTKFTTMVDPLIPIPEEASNVHGITNEVLQRYGAKRLEEYAPIIIDFLKDAVWVTFNGENFDIPLLIQEFMRIGKTFIKMENIETIDAYRIYIKNHGRTLTDAYREYVGEDMVDAHKASADVEATMMILEKQITAHQLENFTLKEIINYSKLDKNGNAPTYSVFVDASRKFAFKNGKTYFAFGKHKEKAALAEKDYLGWMSTATLANGSKMFAEDTLEHVHKLLNGKSQ